MIQVEVNRARKTIHISRLGKEFTSGKVYSNGHAKAIEKRFKAWDAMGWPYEPGDDVPCYMVKTSNLIRD